MWFCLRRFVRCRGSVVPRDDLEETGLAQEEVNGLKVLPRLRQNHFQRGMTPCLRRVPLGAPNTFHIFRAQHFLHWFYIGFTWHSTHNTSGINLRGLNGHWRIRILGGDAVTDIMEPYGIP